MKLQNEHQPLQFSLALVTGASSGIGMAFCRLLAEQGIALMITGRDEKRLNVLADELRKCVKVMTFSADLNLLDECEKVVQYIYDHGPDLIINNAGFGLYGDALTYDTSKQLEILNVNATAVLHLTLEGARALISSGKKGLILNVSSSAAMQVFPGLAVYSAAKAFVNQVSESLDYEMRPYGIRILSSCPGMVTTSFSKRAGGAKGVFEERSSMSAAFAASQIWKQIQNRTPLYIFGWKTRVGTFLSRYLLPKSWVANFLKKNIDSRHPPKSFVRKNRSSPDRGL